MVNNDFFKNLLLFPIDDLETRISDLVSANLAFMGIGLTIITVLYSFKISIHKTNLLIDELRNKKGNHSDLKDNSLINTFFNSELYTTSILILKYAVLESFAMTSLILITRNFNIITFQKFEFVFPLLLSFVLISTLHRVLLILFKIIEIKSD